MNTLTPVQFHNQTIFTVEQDGMLYIPMRTIVENMGLNWKSQHVKLTERFRKGIQIITTPSAGGPQETLCLPITKLAGYLCTISPNKVAPHLRELVVAYQEECDQVLHRHWITKHEQQHNALNALLGAHFERHPGWLDLVRLASAGLSQRTMAERLGIHRRNVQRKLRRIERAGIDWRQLPADALAQPPVNRIH